MRHLTNLWHRLAGSSPAPEPDPFRTLELEQRLSRLAEEISVHSTGTGRQFASGFHGQAALLAYDRTLDEACRLAGIELPDDCGSARRLMAEAALAQLGWTW